MRIEPQQHVLLAAQAAVDKHAEGVLIIDVRRLSTVADYFVMATAMTHRQLQAVAEHIEAQLKRAGHRVDHIEGVSQTRASDLSEELAWVLMDCGDVVVHLFNPPARVFYQLERLWADAPRIPLEHG